MAVFLKIRLSATLAKGPADLLSRSKNGVSRWFSQSDGPTSRVFGPSLLLNWITNSRLHRCRKDEMPR
ncbi:hypothetical protein D3C83_127770 [compost metagenome]